MTTANIPTIGLHRGVALHDQQSLERLEVVKAAIDAVFNESDWRQLLKIVANPSWPPESRLFAGAKLEAIQGIAADKREVRPAFDLGYVRAALAGVGSQQWRDPERYASLLDHGHYGADASKAPVPRANALRPRGAN